MIISENTAIIHFNSWFLFLGIENCLTPLRFFGLAESLIKSELYSEVGGTFLYFLLTIFAIDDFWSNGWALFLDIVSIAVVSARPVGDEKVFLPAPLENAQ